MDNKDIKLSIIVPIYNVEKYIYECISSIYRQNLNEEEFEVILVNDGTKDNSMEVLIPIIKQHSNILVINQQNQGLSASRNNGLAKAVGKYVVFIDSDDVIIDNSLSILLKQALDTDVDTIKGKVIKIEDSQLPSQGVTCQFPEPSITIKNGEAAYVEDYNREESYVPQNLYKREFLKREHLSLLVGLIFEDVAFYSEMCLKAKTFAISNIPFYIYRQREGSIMSTMNKDKLISMNIVNEHIFRLGNELPISEKTKKTIIDNIFYSTVSINTWYITHYRNIYPHWREILNDLNQRIPLSTFNITYKQRIIAMCLKYIPNTYLWIRYKLNKKKYG